MRYTTIGRLFKERIEPMFQAGLTDIQIAEKMQGVTIGDITFDFKRQDNGEWNTFGIETRREDWEKRGRKLSQTYGYRKIVEAKKGDYVHHIDLDRSNNIKENLVTLNSLKEHNEVHRQQRKFFAGLFKLKIVGFDKQKKQYFLIK